ncbi:MAG: hypothetical protein ACETWT_18300 [Thermodesulfobacteriota bacterium]
MTEGNFLSNTWEDFEAWIKEKVGGEICWKVRPEDTKVNRMIVAMSVLTALEGNCGAFPPSGNAFIELQGGAGTHDRRPSPEEDLTEANEPAHP